MNDKGLNNAIFVNNAHYSTNKNKGFYTITCFLPSVEELVKASEKLLNYYDHFGYSGHLISSRGEHCMQVEVYQINC